MVNDARKTRVEGKRARISDFGKTDQSQDLITCRIYQNYKKKSKAEGRLIPFSSTKMAMMSLLRHSFINSKSD